MAQHANLVTIARLRGTRTLFRQRRRSPRTTGRRGIALVWCAVRFAQAINLGTAGANSHHHPYQSAQPDLHGAEAGLARPADARHTGLRMHTQQFTLVHVRLLDAAGQRASTATSGWSYWRRRQELTLLEIQQAYTSVSIWNISSGSANNGCC